MSPKQTTEETGLARLLNMIFPKERLLSDHQPFSPLAPLSEQVQKLNQEHIEKMSAEDQEQELKIAIPLVFLTYRRPSEIDNFKSNVIKELRTRGFNVKILGENQ